MKKILPILSLAMVGALVACNKGPSPVSAEDFIKKVTAAEEKADNPTDLNRIALSGSFKMYDEESKKTNESKSTDDSYFTISWNQTNGLYEVVGYNMEDEFSLVSVMFLPALCPVLEMDTESATVLAPSAAKAGAKLYADGDFIIEMSESGEEEGVKFEGKESLVWDGTTLFAKKVTFKEVDDGITMIDATFNLTWKKVA